jgi:hypothetical protein
MKTWMWFVLIAVVSWGAYVPMIHKGAQALGGGKGSFRAFLFVGLAYFLMAGAILLYLAIAKVEPGDDFAGRGFPPSCILGRPGLESSSPPAGTAVAYCRPLVFAGAPIVNVCIHDIQTEPPRPCSRGTPPLQPVRPWLRFRPT